MKYLMGFVKFIDFLNDLVGRLVSYLVVPLTFIIVYEVVVRYFFSSPTIWAWDVNMYLGGLMLILGGGYAHLNKGHVNVEFILEKWEQKNKVLIDIILSPFIIIPLVILFMYSLDASIYSFKIKEHHTSLWEPPIYPLRMAIPVGSLLFLLQSVSRLISDIELYFKLRNKKD